MSKVFLDRDNVIRYRLQKDGSTITPNSVTRAQLFFSGRVTVSGDDILLDTDEAGNALTLNADATEIEIRAGQQALTPGRTQCFLTLYDAANPNGIAWAEIPITITQWQPDI